MISSNAQTMTAKIVVVFSMLFIVLFVTVLGFGEWTGAFSVYDFDFKSAAVGDFGMTVLSVDKTEFTKSTIPLFSGDVWVAHIRPGGLLQNFEGKTVSKTITPSDMSNKGANVEPESNMIIDIESSRQECIYPLQADYDSKTLDEDSNSHIYTIQLYEKDKGLYGCSKSDFEEMCGPDYYTGGQYKVTRFFTSNHCWCTKLVKHTQKTDISIPTTPKIHTVTRFAITIDGVKKERTFDTLREFGEAESGFLPVDDKTKAYVLWDGYTQKSSCVYADSGDSDSTLRDTGNYVGIMTNDYSWHIIEKSSYNNYRSLKTSVFDDMKDREDVWNEGVQPFNEMKDIINRYNSEVQNNVVNYKDSVFGDIKTVSGQPHNAIIVQDMKSNVYLPNYVLYIKADWLKIKQPTNAKPYISSARYVEDNSPGRSGVFTISGENVGTERGEFTYSVDCEYPFFVITDPIYKSLNPGDVYTANIDIGLKGTVSDEVCIYCIARMSNKFGVEKTKRIEICERPDFNCVPNKNYCGGGSNSNKMFTCKTDGSGYKDKYTDCSPGSCNYKENMIAECVTHVPPNGDDDDDDKEMCNSAEDCDDDDWLTVDKCDKSFVGSIFGSKGVCTHLDLTPIIVVLGLLFGMVVIVLFILFVAGIVTLIKNIKK